MRRRSPRAPLISRLWSMLGAMLAGCVAIALVAAPSDSALNPWPSPALLLIIVILWRARKAEAMPLGLVFALGVLHDIALGAPLGVCAIAMLAACRLRDMEALARSEMETGPGGWLAFALAGAVYFLLYWGLSSLAALHPYAFGPTIWHYLVTILSYPIAAFLLGRVFGLGWAQGGTMRGGLR